MLAPAPWSHSPGGPAVEGYRRLSSLTAPRLSAGLFAKPTVGVRNVNSTVEGNPRGCG
jgi:hypothetical protein